MTPRLDTLTSAQKAMISAAAASAFRLVYKHAELEQVTELANKLFQPGMTAPALSEEIVRQMTPSKKRRDSSMSRLDAIADAVDCMVQDAQRLRARMDALGGRADAAYSEPFVKDISAYIRSLDLKGGASNVNQIIDYVINRKSFDAITLSDKFGCTVGNGKSIQNKMKELRTLYGEGGAGTKSSESKGAKLSRQLGQQVGPRR